MSGHAVMESNVVGNRLMRRTVPNISRLPLDALKISISRLSDADVDLMSRKDLIDLVKFSGLEEMSTAGRAHLAYLDDHELKRLACLARFVCLRTVNSEYAGRGKKCPVPK